MCALSMTLSHRENRESLKRDNKDYDDDYNDNDYDYDCDVVVVVVVV